jgi:hypothetical protein
LTRKKLPELRMIIDNLEIFKISISLIFYSLYFSNCTEVSKVTDFLTMFFQNMYNINVSGLVKTIWTTNSPLEGDKSQNYNEIILETIKQKNVPDIKEIDKFYGLDKLTQAIIMTEEGAKNSTTSGKDTQFSSMFCESSKNESISSNNENNSEISLTPSLQSQDSGKTYKETVIREDNGNNVTEDSEALFYPVKLKNNNLLFGNENCFVLVRYIFCIYERLNKVINCII